MGLVRHDAPQTSRDADARNAPREGTQRAKVLNFIRACGGDGATDEELQDETGLNPNTARPRRVELVRDGWIRDSGRRRKTRGGDEAIVWVFVPFRPVAELVTKPAQGVLF